MNFVIILLAFTGLLAICVWGSSCLFKWTDAASQRKHETEKHRAAVIDSLKRIEAAIAKSNTAAR